VTVVYRKDSSCWIEACAMKFGFCLSVKAGAFHGLNVGYIRTVDSRLIRDMNQNDFSRYTVCIIVYSSKKIQ